MPVIPHVVGRYALYGEIAAGGMATVHYGRLSGPAGFSRTVAIKRLHAPFARDPEFVSMFLDEARLVARIRHPNVVQTLDVVALEGELFIVMDYVQGESLARLLTAAIEQKSALPLPIVSAIMCGALHGLHAAHEATDERGEPLRIVHRDVSPQNLLLGADGVPRVLDFGVAKAAGRCRTTRNGGLKGKLAYMAPEQFRGTVDRRSDVFGAGVVLWETLTRSRLFAGDSEPNVMAKVLTLVVAPPSAYASGIPRELDSVVLRALERDPAKRFGSAREMAIALEASAPMASAPRTADWLAALVGDVLAERARAVAEVELQSDAGVRPSLQPLDTSDDSVSQTGSSPAVDTLTDSISGSSASRPAGNKRRSPTLYVLGGMVAALGLFAAVRFGQGPVAAAAGAVPSPPAASVTAAGSVDDPPSAAPSETNQTPLVATAPASVVATTVPTHPRAPSPKARTKPAPHEATPPPPPPSCTPPYTLDENGFRHYKRECER